MLLLDGSFGEGGGQILRTSLALALVTGRPFHLQNVRVRRARPGLQPQHLMSVQAAAAVGAARTEGAVLRSTDLVFEPGAVTPGGYHFDIRTAGATGLVLHTVYLPLAWRADAASTVVLVGGTHNEKAPCFHFNETTWRAYLARLGLDVALHMRRPGFYPRGGGVVEARVEPCARLRALGLDAVEPATRIAVVSAVAGLPESIARRQSRQAELRLQESGLPVEVREETWAGGPGTVVLVTLDTRPAPTLFFGLGARGKPAERVADEAAEQALAYLRTIPPGVDPHSADQLLVPLALAEGPSTYRVAEVTQHLLTNAVVVGKFVDRAIVCDGAEGGPGVVRIS